MSAERTTPTAAEWYKIIEAVEPGAMQRLFDEFFTHKAFVEACRMWAWSSAGKPDDEDKFIYSPIAKSIDGDWLDRFGVEGRDYIFDLDTRVCRFVQAWYL